MKSEVFEKGGKAKEQGPPRGPPPPPTMKPKVPVGKPPKPVIMKPVLPPMGITQERREQEASNAQGSEIFQGEKAEPKEISSSLS